LIKTTKRTTHIISLDNNFTPLVTPYTKIEQSFGVVAGDDDVRCALGRVLDHVNSVEKEKKKSENLNNKKKVGWMSV